MSFKSCGAVCQQAFRTVNPDVLFVGLEGQNTLWCCNSHHFQTKCVHVCVCEEGGCLLLSGGGIQPAGAGRTIIMLTEGGATDHRAGS